MPRSIGIIGYGAFGRLCETLAKRFVPGASVKIFSPSLFKKGQGVSLKEACACDVVVLAVPIRAFQGVLKRVAPLLGPSSVLLDVATVKVHTTTLLEKISGRVRYVAAHPMWGPESYEKKKGDVSGFRIVVTDVNIPRAAYKKAVSFARTLGFDVVRMDAKRHDKHLAETLFLTHFVGQIVSRARFDRTEIDTVSFGYLMDAVESVRHDEALFRDVFSFNPYCKDVLKRFRAGEREVRELLV